MTRYGKCGYDDKNVVINNYLLLFQTVWQFVAESIVVRDKKNLSIKILKGFLDPKLNMETETITRDFDFRQVWGNESRFKNQHLLSEWILTNELTYIDLLFVPFSPFPASPAKSSKLTLDTFLLEFDPEGGSGHLHKHRESWDNLIYT
jgi:hypothetical protein